MFEDFIFGTCFVSIMYFLRCTVYCTVAENIKNTTRDTALEGINCQVTRRRFLYLEYMKSV